MFLDNLSETWARFFKISDLVQEIKNGCINKTTNVEQLKEFTHHVDFIIQNIQNTLFIYRQPPQKLKIKPVKCPLNFRIVLRKGE
jgi:hypothetical protein